MGMAAILVIWPGPAEQIFILPTYQSFTWNSALMCWENLQQKMFESKNMSDLGQRSNNDLNLCAHLVNYVCQFSVHRLQQFQWNLAFKHFPIQKH